MRWSTLCVVLLGAAVIGCEPATFSRQQRAVAEQFIGNRLSAWTTALNNGAQDTLIGLYDTSPQLNVVWPDGRWAVGFDELEQSIADTYNLWDMVNYGPINAQVDLIDEQVAVVTYRHSLDIRFVDTRRQVSSGHTTLVFVKDEEDGLWKIRRQHISVNAVRGLSGR